MVLIMSEFQAHIFTMKTGYLQTRNTPPLGANRNLCNFLWTTATIEATGSLVRVVLIVIINMTLENLQQRKN